MSSCVIKNKDFYSLAEEHGVDGSELELIVHKYWNEVGREDSFPPSSYINEQLGIGKSYDETSENVRKLWDRDYSRPIKFRSEYELNEAVQKTKTFFPADTITTYKDNKGNFVLRVAEPFTSSSIDKEIQDILAKAPRDSQGRLLAPNGKISNLTEKQYAQVRTKAFKKWFGDWENDPANASKVVDENGEPLVVYHGNTDTNITKFTKGKGRYLKDGNYYFSPSKSVAESYATNGLSEDIDINDYLVIGYNVDANSEEAKYADFNSAEEFFNASLGGKVYPVFLNIKNPIFSDTITPKIEKPYDGAITIPVNDTQGTLRGEKIRQYIATESNQIKSATDNVGTFFTTDDNINHDTTTANVVSSSSISYIGQKEATTRVQSFIDSIDKSGEYGQAIQEFIDTFGIPVVNKVIFNITQANTHSSSWNNFTRALKLGFSEMASSEEKAAVTLHELIHSRTTSLANLYEKAHGVKSLKSKEKSKVFESLPSEALTPEIEKAFDNIVECKAEVLKYLEENHEIKEALLSTDVTTNLNKRPLYAILKETNKYGVKEFISEIYTNPAFIQLLKSIPTKVENQTLWNRIINAFKSIFGGKKSFVGVLDRARENADIIVRAGNNVNASFETISEDASSLPIGQQRVQLRNYYASLQTRSSQEFKQIKALASQAFKSKHTFTSESAAKAIADKYIRDNHIDSDMVAYTYGYKVKGQNFFVPVIKWKSDTEYANAKYVSARNYVNSLTNNDVESEVLRLSTDEEMFDSTFTFKDGTTIDTPFELNDQQKTALQKLDDFAKDKSKTAITLSGYAGTGKTSLMEMVAKKLGLRHNVVFSATTHQAAGVLKSKVGKYGFDTRTVNSLFGIAVATDMEGTKYDASKKVRNLGDDRLQYGDIVIIDEASMLSDENYNDVVEIAKNKNAKVIFVGDKAQLVPVGQNEVSKVFRDSNGEVVELTKVERTGDNAILSEATAIRNGQNFTYESAFNAQGQGVAYVTPQSTDIISSIIETFTPGLKTNPNYLRILAFTNASVANYNSKVRQSLGYNGLAPQVGEPMLGYANWGYDRSRAASGDPYQFVNSRSYKVVATQAPYKSGVRLSDGTICSFDIIPLRLEDSMGEQVTVPFINIKNNTQNRNSAKLVAQEKAILWTKWRTAQGMQKNILLKTINELENFLFINDNLTGDQNNLLQAKVIDFGYAHTIHKSQGGTYTHVIMDDGGIEGSRSSAERKQQLKYVGVSRATDTVTIISPQTKKADSPVNHMQVSPEEVNNSNVAPTRPQNTQAESINIYAGTGENAHLSNFAIRPFTHTWTNGNTMQMQSVEQAFQIAKAATAKDVESIRKMQQTTDGATLRKLGRAVKGLDVAQWDANKATWMKTFIKESFMQNPKALEQLLATGNATLTHNQDRSAWGQMFPQILMQVREELRNYTPTESSLVEAVLNQFSSYFEGGGADIMKAFPGLSKEIVDKLENHIMGDGEFTEANARRFLEEAKNKPSTELTPSTSTPLQDPRVALAEHTPSQQGTTNMLPPVSPSDVDTTTPKNQIPTPNADGPLKGFTLHSGGAIGADFAWGNIGASYGVSGKHYFDATDTREGKKPPYGNTPITDEERTLGERKAFHAGKQMGRLSSKAQKVTDPLLIRDWNQVKNSDMVVAIAQKFDMPGDKFSNKSDDERVALVQQVSGGTGWAVQMAIAEGKPVFVFNQADGKWYMNFMGVWKYAEAPVLSNNFAGIGTRGINAASEAAIRECYEKTVASMNNQSVRPTVEETVTQAEKPFNRESLSPEMQKEFDRLTKRTTQINNILSSGVMTSIEAREIVNSLMNLITDYITEIINDPAINDVALKEQGNDAYLANLLVNKNFKGLIAPFNPKGLTRLEIINKIGIDNLVNVFLKSKLTATATTTRAQAKKMRVLSQNLDALLYLGANTLSINEGIHLTTTRVNGKEMKAMEEGVVVNPDLNSARDLESIQENEGSLQEKWQIDSRTIDVVESMSQLVRNELFKLYQLDSNGNKITDGIGIYKRVPVQETTKQLLSWLQGCLTLKDVVARLKDKQTENPWVKQLIDVLDVEALGENAGQHTDFQNSFFSVFNKHFQSYSATTITYDKDGVQHIKRIPLNEKPFLKETLGQIKVDIASGIHPLFTANNGVNQLAFENFKTVLDTLHTIRDNKIVKIGFDEMSGADRQLAFEAISQAASLLGYPTDATTLGNILNGREIRNMITNLDNMYDDILANINNPNYEPLTFTRGEDGKKGSGIRGSLTKFLEPLTKHLANISVSAIFDSGKMYQSYVTPSYMTKLKLKIKQEDSVKFDQFIQEEFGKYDWFRDTSIRDTKAGWKSGWIGLLARDAAARKVFNYEAKLNYNKHNYMKNMTGNEYIMSLLSSFFSEGAGNGRDGAIAWYRIPILSNKPSEEYIRFYADMGQDYKEVISTKMAKVFNQELSRIQTVRMQNYDKSDPRFIKNFHENGKKFCFLDFMNVYLEGGARANTELGKLLRAKLEGTNWDVANEPRLLDLAKQAIQANMQTRIDEILKNYETRGIMEIAENIDGIKQGFGKDNIAENIERFLWNDAYAATQILQLTVTDIAYYKDMEDLQKRIAQIHAPGVRGNAEAVDYEGNRVSDGLERTMYLTDFAGVKSNIIDNVKIVFDRKLEELKNQPLDNFSNTKLKTDEDIQRATEAKQHRIMIQEELYNSILKQFEDINVADAQGYSSPTSYRKKMFIFGKWSREAENIYQKLLTGNYNYHDLQVAFQPLKPFVYSQITKPTGLENGPLKSLKMPVQNKNSEYLLIMADAILQGENTGQPNLLRAIYEVMEESAKASPTKGIDTIQFESTVKSGLMGRNDINRVLEGGKWNELIEVRDPNTGKTVQRTRGEVAAKAYLQHNLYSKDANGVVTGYNSTFVHEIPFEDYCIQQEVPEHFKDHAQQHGSQIRMITPSDLLSVDTYGNPVTYNVEGRELSAKEFREEYEQTIADNIQQSINEVFRELHLDAANPIEKNIVLSRMLQDEILSSPRYGLDMYLACSLNPVTGEFRIPLGDPIQANRIEQLLNSIVKKRVNEQKIAGGPVVQVSNFGTSRRLNIRFKDKNGGLLKTREEFTKDWKPVEPAKIDVKSLANKLMKEEKLSYTIALKEAKRRIEESQNAPQQNADEAYAEYIKTNQGGIAYFEVFAPIFNEEIFTRFADPDGTIDIATMEKVCPEALQMIGYRIPTEDKYSCAPIKIVGFLPREAGEGIMLPYDITLLTGSDFDVDKEYLMRKQIHVNLKPFKEQYEALEPLFLAEKKKESKLTREFTPQELKQFKSELSDMIDMFRSNDRTRSYIREAGANPIEKKMWQKFKEVGYNIIKATKDKEYKDNKIFDMTWEVLSHETTADKMLNPGGFEEQKKMAYLAEAYRNSDKTWEELQTMKTDDLKKLSYSTKNLIFSDSQVQFYEQNNAASTILGMFAVQKIGHAVLESNGYQIDVEEACDIAEPFTIMGKQFGGKMEFDPMIDDEGNVIGKTLGSHVAAAADAAKEPCMNLLNINSMTANVHSTLIRLGMPFRHASLFLAQPVIRELLDRYNKRNLTDFTSLDTILNEYIQEFREEGNMVDSAIEHEEITEQELIDNLRANKPETNYKVANAFGKLQKLAYAIKGPTYLTRYNSISNAVGPLITDNIVTEFKTNYETVGLYDRNGNELVPEIVFADHPVLKKFADAYVVANKIFEEFPTKSQAFSEVLESIPGSLQDKFLNDRGLLNDLKDFFLSHTLVDNKVVNENRAGYYIKEFAGEFAANGIKEKNLDNEFIQAIKIKQDKDTGEFSLELSTTGMDQQKKDRLSASWYELYKKNQPLAMDLFNYCFFKGGIGFNPKTFMNLLPLQMRESIQGYKESFTNIPTESAKYILEQFLAHNTSNHKLFPIKEGEKDVVGGGLIIQDKAELSQFTDIPAFKIKDSNNRWRYLLLDKVTDDALAYKEIIPLGGNGEYLEMSSTRVPNISIREIYGTNKKAKQASQQQKAPVQKEVTSNSNHPIEDTNRGLVTSTPAQEKAKAERLIKGIMNSELGMRTPELAKKYLTNNAIINAEGKVEISNPTVWKYISAAMESQGLKVNKEELLDVLKQLC